MVDREIWSLKKLQVAAAAAAAAAAADSAQWLSVKEETIFLHDGLIRVTDLAELPSEILGAPEAADTDLEVSEAAPGPRHRTGPLSRRSRVGPLPRPSRGPRLPGAAGAGVCGRGAGRWGPRPQVCRPPAPLSLPPSSGPGARRGFHLWFSSERSDTRHFIRLAPGSAFMPRRSRHHHPGLPPLPHGPPGPASRAHPGCLALGTFLF